MEVASKEAALQGKVSGWCWDSLAAVVRLETGLRPWRGECEPCACRREGTFSGAHGLVQGDN